MREKITTSQRFFERFGSLHDARINNIQFNTREKTLTVAVVDLDVCSIGLPNYCGPLPGALVFEKVLSMTLDLKTAEGLRIGELRIEEAGIPSRLEIDLNLGGGELTSGKKSISATFSSFRVEAILE